MGDEKIYMLNALWFKKDGGAQKYAEYGAAAGPIVRALGGRPLEGYVPEASLIGEWQPDVFFVVEYPSWNAFLQLGQDENYKKIAHLRTEALENSLLIRCSRVPGI